MLPSLLPPPYEHSLFLPTPISGYFCKDSIMTHPQHTTPLQASLLVPPLTRSITPYRTISFIFYSCSFVFICVPFVLTRVHSCSIRVHSCFFRVHSCSFVFIRVHSCSFVFTRVPFVFRFVWCFRYDPSCWIAGWIVIVFLNNYKLFPLWLKQHIYRRNLNSIFLWLLTLSAE